MLAPGKGGTRANRIDRDVLVRLAGSRAAQLAIGDLPLAFGRIDRDDGGRHYVGRVGVDDEGDGDPLVVDWRAPVAEPFYRATGIAPMGLTRRRHFTTFGRRITGIDDEVFDGQAVAERGLVLLGEGALLASLDRARSGRMGDIVATIQKEQDEIIRSPLAGVLVVQGGPGTGKTVVALHRAAYLLYTHRMRLSRQGVLIVGPNATFLRYIEHVLPALGESAVVLSTSAGLRADTTARDVDPPATPTR